MEWGASPRESVTVKPGRDKSDTCRISNLLPKPGCVRLFVAATPFARRVTRFLLAGKQSGSHHGEIRAPHSPLLRPFERGPEERGIYGSKGDFV